MQGGGTITADPGVIIPADSRREAAARMKEGKGLVADCLAEAALPPAALHRFRVGAEGKALAQDAGDLERTYMLRPAQGGNILKENHGRFVEAQVLDRAGDLSPLDQEEAVPGHLRQEQLPPAEAADIPQAFGQQALSHWPSSSSSEWSSPLTSRKSSVGSNCSYSSTDQTSIPVLSRNLR